MIRTSAHGEAAEAGAVLRVDLGHSQRVYDLEVPSRAKFARSPAYDTIVRELSRYLNDQIRGRSFLVAGHRGAGKTSMVLRAVEDLRDRALEPGFDPDRPQERPLAVRLHGPALLAALHGDAAAAGGDEDADGEAAAASSDAMEQILSQLMISTYRELAAEVVRGYRQRLKEDARLGRPGRGMSEAVAQLDLALDNAPPPEELREYWRRAGALESGLFWPRDMARDAAGPDGRGEHQGALELVAVATAAQAYRVISGDVSYSDDKSDEATRATKVETAATLTGKAIADKVLGFAAGGLVGGAWFSQHADQPFVAALAGLVTAFIAAWTFKLTTSRERKRSRTAKYTFIRKSDVSTLDRELPVVIRRIREAGLAPVFIVDELDKVAGLETVMAGLVRRLKHIVADRFFFCFLTDRDYFELLQRKSRDLPYPQEHTYFSQRLFILYRPGDLHGYLDEILVTPDHAAADDAVTAYRGLVSTLVLHRAMLHVFDLQRELSRLCDEDGNILVLLRELRSHYGYRFHIAMQLAIEHILAEDEMRDRIDQEPYFGQFAYDALYYLSRCWQKGERALDLSDAAIDAYLARRIDTHWAEEQLNGDGDAADPDADAERVRKIVGDAVNAIDHEALKDSVRRLAGLLAAPERLIRALSADENLGEDRHPLISVVPGEGQPLLTLDGEQGVWNYDYYGRALEAADRGEPDALTAAIEAAIALGGRLTAAEQDLRQAAGMDFADAMALGLLSTSPDWEEVRLTLERLSEAAGPNATADEGQVRADIMMVEEFRDMLLRRTPLILMALATALELRRVHGGDRPLEEFHKAVSDGLDLTAKARPQATEDIEELLKAFWPEAGLSAPVGDLEDFGRGVDEVMKHDQGAGPARPDALEHHLEAFWRIWLERLKKEGAVGADGYRVTFSELVMRTTDGRGDLIVEGLRERTIRGLRRISLPFYLDAGNITVEPEQDIRIPDWAVLWSVVERQNDVLFRALAERSAKSEELNWLTDREDFSDRQILHAAIYHSGSEFPVPWRTERGISAELVPSNPEPQVFDEMLQTVGKDGKFDLAIIYLRDNQSGDFIVRMLKRAREKLADPDFIVAMAHDPDRLRDIPGIPVIRTPGSLGEAVLLAEAAIADWQAGGQKLEKAPASAVKRAPRRRK